MLKNNGFSQLNNDYIDNYMSIVSPTATLVFLAITRKTLGWQKEIDIISYSQMQKITGLSVNTIKKAIDELIAIDVIEQITVGSGRNTQNYYRVKIETVQPDNINNDSKSNTIISNSDNDSKQSKINMSISDIIKPDIMSNSDTIQADIISNFDTTKDNNNINKKEINKYIVNKNIVDYDNQNDYNKQAIELTQYLYDNIMKYVKPPAYKNKPPKLESWKNDIAKMIKIDKIEYEDIKSIIDFTVRHDFWSINVLSGKALRKYYNRLYLEKQRSKKSRRVTNEQLADLYQETQKLAENINPLIKGMFDKGAKK